MGSETDQTYSVVLGDVDGDGDLDLVAGNYNQTNKLYRNDGSGHFSATGTALGSETDQTYSVVLGDIDGDGDLDLVAGNYGETNKLYLNDGSGHFSTTGTAVGSETDQTYSVALGDVDRDGDLDLVAGNYGHTNKLYQTISYLTHNQMVVSTQVNNGGAVAAVMLSAIETVNTATTRNTSIDYYPSNDGGAHWYQVYSGKTFLFPSSDTDLRWKAVISSLSPVRTPVLHQIFIDLDTDADGIINSLDPDDDNDGLTDTVENQIGTDPLVFDDQSLPLAGTRIDSDGDGLTDYYEINVSGTDPNATTTLTIGPPGDTNGDGVVNAGDAVLLQRLILGY